MFAEKHMDSSSFVILRDELITNNAAVISSILPASPPVPCAQNGTTVLPEKSYPSIKEKTAIGAIYHQLGCENLHRGRFSVIYQHFNTIHTFLYFSSFCSLFNALTNFRFSFFKFSFSSNSLFISL